MKILIKITLITLITFFLAGLTFSQNGRKLDDEKGCFNNQESTEYKDWKKVKLPKLTFYIPKDLIESEISCIDRSCYEFGNDDLILGIDVSSAAFHPSYEKEFANYCEKFIRIDKAEAWIWYYDVEQTDREYKYRSGALFTFNNIKNYKIGMTFSSKSKNIAEIGEKIFRSVKFRNKPRRR